MWDQVRQIVSAIDAGSAAWLALGVTQRDTAYERWQAAYGATPAHLPEMTRQRMADQATCEARIADADARDEARDAAYSAAMA